VKADGTAYCQLEEVADTDLHGRSGHASCNPKMMAKHAKVVL